MADFNTEEFLSGEIGESDVDKVIMKKKDLGKVAKH